MADVAEGEMVRGRWGIWGVVFLLVCLRAGQGHSAVRVYKVQSSITLSEASINADGEFSFLPDIDHAIGSRPGEPSVVWLPESLKWDHAMDDLRIVLTIGEADTFDLPLPLAPAQSDIISSDTSTLPAFASPDSAIYNSDSWFPGQTVRLVDLGQLGETRLVNLAWCPLRYNPAANRLIFVRVAYLTLTNESLKSDSPDTSRVTDALLEACVEADSWQSSAVLTPSYGDGPSWTFSAGAPTNVQYVVVTKAAFVGAMKPLVLWKARKGVSAGIATIEDITSQYAGVDQAESVREYLKAAYAKGLNWVVIGGDETVAPVRRAYAEFPAYDGDPYKLQQCDLYFAELNGNWDADGDGIWGEYFGDQAQVQPELYVGRLPFSTAAEATAIVNKIIAYERGPSQSAYLTKSLSVSTDQFRDWNSGQGQHGAVATSMPAMWTHDLATMIEAPTGGDPAPLLPDPGSFGTALASGAGWVNYFVHGRADGFVVRSAGIMEWPRAYVFTNGAGGDGNAYLNLAPSTSLAGIHLSAACDQGGFDLDSPPYSYDVGESVAEKLLFMPGGAVAFVGQSRWGWVSTSYKLIQKFYEYVNTPATPNHVGAYQTLSKLAYSSFRDLTFGNNLYGDPEMPVWKSTPLSLTVQSPVTFSPGINNWNLRALSGANGVSGVTVTVSVGDSVWMLGQSGVDGSLYATVTLPVAAEAIITARKDGYRIWADTLPVSIISGIFDDGDAVPSSYLTLSNYPNPFNAGTVLSLSLPYDWEVAFDVFDVLGRRVRTLSVGMLPAGAHRVPFDGHDDAGRPLANGVYFARAAMGERVVMRKLMLVR
jgi:hypothetical protein